MTGTGRWETQKALPQVEVSAQRRHLRGGTFLSCDQEPHAPALGRALLEESQRLEEEHPLPEQFLLWKRRQDPQAPPGFL